MARKEHKRSQEVNRTKPAQFHLVFGTSLFRIPNFPCQRSTHACLRWPSYHKRVVLYPVRYQVFCTLEPIGRKELNFFSVKNVKYVSRFWEHFWNRRGGDSGCVRSGRRNI